MLAHEDAQIGHDPRYVPIVSVISQDAVCPQFSGSCVPLFENELTIEGRHGRGDEFMVGQSGPEVLPEYVHQAVAATYDSASKLLGSVEFEWVFDGRSVWVVQLHRSKRPSLARHPAKMAKWHKFDVKRGLESLQDFITSLDPEQDGVVLVGDVGVTSHFGDILRAAGLAFQVEKP
jgi:hypothetical protein